jgi:hypothetical protein
VGLSQLGLLPTQEYRAKLGELGEDPDEDELEALRETQAVELYAQWRPASGDGASGEKDASEKPEPRTGGTTKAAPTKAKLPTTGDPLGSGAACAAVLAAAGAAVLVAARKERSR